MADRYLPVQKIVGDEPYVVREWYRSGGMIHDNMKTVDVYSHPIAANVHNKMNDYYRIVNYGPYFQEDGMYWETKDRPLTLNALDDILETGSIRGSKNFGRKAYFAAGTPVEDYRVTESHLRHLANTDGLKANPKDVKNLYIQVTDEFLDRIQSGKNPLYDKGGVVIATGDNNRDVAKKRSGYVTMKPSKDKPSFIQRINPENRAGVRLVQTDPVDIADRIYYRQAGPVPQEILDERFIKVGDNLYATKSSVGTVIPNEMESVRATIGSTNPVVLYDGITPVKERTIGQHARNALWNMKSVIAQPEVQKGIGAVGTAAKVAVGTAGVLGYANEVANKGPIIATIEYGIPFTPLRMGIGPVNDLGAPEKAPADKLDADAQDELDYILHGPVTPVFRNSSGEIVPTPRTIPNKQAQRDNPKALINLEHEFFK
jgi:hypothetical protein